MSAWAAALRRGRRGAPDEGQIMILSLGFAVVALLLVLVVTAATAVHLDRKRLLAVADLAVLAAADEVDGYYGEPAARGERGIPLTDVSVRRAVTRYVTAHPDPAATWDRVEVLEASAPDDRSARVRLGAVSRPPVVGWVLEAWTGGIPLEVEATARAS